MDVFLEQKWWRIYPQNQSRRNIQPMAKSVDIYEIIESCAKHSDIFGFHLARVVPKNNQKMPYMDAREIIDNHEWGTHGESGKEPLTKVFLINCETNHLKNILRTQPQITALTTLVIMAILMERGEISKTSNVIKISSKSKQTP